MKLAVIDLDGVVADNTARFAKAEKARQAYIDSPHDDLLLGWNTKTAQDIFWRTAFTPELVALDTLIEGVPEALDTLENQGYTIFFLTSRPESMRQATVDWFWLHSSEIVLISNGYDSQLVMKVPAFQYVKTVTWKAGMVQTLAALYGADTVLFIDDEPNNTEATIDTWNNDKISLRCCSSLELAISVDGRFLDEM